MTRKWDADPASGFRRRLGMPAQELGVTDGKVDCPDIWELDNGDVAVIGRDLTAHYASRLPEGVVISQGERLVVIPGNMMISARPDIPIADPLEGATGERLELADYFADFLDRYGRASEFWKLEAGQVFAEPGNESWKAFDRGDWQESLRLLEERRAQLADNERQDAARGMRSRRIRIVCLPPTEYLQWELHSLKIRDEVGETIHVLRGDELLKLKGQVSLPEINIIGTDAVYQVMYDDNGVVDHAIRYTDEAVVRRCRDFVIDLYERGEPISEFFEREIAPLPPPRPARQAIPDDYLERTGRPRSPGL